MSAAIRQQPTPRSHEGMLFWGDFTNECRSRVQSINAAIRSHGVPVEGWVRMEEDGAGFRIFRTTLPSTEVRVMMNFEAWGPVLGARVTGQESPDRRFSSFDVQIPLSHDLDGSFIAIFDEGRSFSAANVACYLLQNFRRCFPDIVLPY